MQIRINSGDESGECDSGYSPLRVGFRKFLGWQQKPQIAINENLIITGN